MRANAAGLCLSLFFGASACLGQNAPFANTPTSKAVTQPWNTTVYCSGFFTNEKVSDELRLVTGEQSEYKITFSVADTVFLSKGASQGVKEGDKFSVVREYKDALKVPWFKWQDKLTNAMGTHYVDLGLLEVVKVLPNMAIAKVSASCEMMQRGDIVRPFVERPIGPFRDAAAFDNLAPVSGRPVAMVVRGRDTAQMSGRFDTIYVNLGTSQGVKVGDYFRIFRYQGTRAETIPVEKDFQDRLYGFGTNPKKYSWNDLPREVLGEGIVLNASPNSSTVLITVSRNEVYAGDYVEIE